MALSPLRRKASVAVVAGAVVALSLAGCSKSADDSSGTPKADSSGAAQQVQSTGGTGDMCDFTAYGADKLDLTGVTVGFSQSESTSNPFRATETQSITDEAKKLGIKLIQRNANANVSQQNTDIQDMIAQGAKVLIVAPENSDGLAPAFAAAKAKKIPILTIDRTVTGTACSDFIGFIGSDFEGQAKIAAQDMAQALPDGGNIAVLQGTSGNNVAQARTDGFVNEVKASSPNLKIVASQTANFDQATGQKVTEQILQSNPDIKGIYAENDTMALGAIQAIKAAGKTPGKDIMVIGIDGTEDAVKDVASGVMFSDVETNPRFGPLAFKALQDFYGSGTSTNVIIADNHFTKDNAQQALDNGDVY
ncbi:ABC transporter substrate-binding protein [Luteimicrobium subarcticum]|uniref:Monosaccharide ABC transporter substrate-binding protein (CUT2 family) n=1 Tax=Luteimicrobium subarcticum TaxID=620910 RepID=A0A2M8WSK0_9MICO|nr:ABC transporter substrate-binding protein [Luteimicrobium subarcticum]PJI93922.1 monosaccharide ABC transporter substrate-binding protein (CUT2 family) [Luteimicrobium subarcticum]